MNRIRTTCFALMMGSASMACAGSPFENGCPPSPLREVAQREQTIRVLAHLKVGGEGTSNIAEAQSRLLAELRGLNAELLRQYDTQPLLALRLDEPALCVVLSSAHVERVEQDRPDAAN